MFTIEELQRQIDAYRNDRASRQEFFDWFESRCFDAYEDDNLHGICVAIDRAFSDFLCDGADEKILKEELAKTSRPFVWRSESPRAMIAVEHAPYVVPVLVSAMAVSFLIVPSNVSHARSAESVQAVRLSDSHTSGISNGTATEPKCLPVGTA